MFGKVGQLLSRENINALALKVAQQALAYENPLTTRKSISRSYATAAAARDRAMQTGGYESGPYQTPERREMLPGPGGLPITPGGY